MDLNVVPDSGAFMPAFPSTTTSTRWNIVLPFSRVNRFADRKKEGCKSSPWVESGPPEPNRGERGGRGDSPKGICSAVSAPSAVNPRKPVDFLHLTRDIPRKEREMRKLPFFAVLALAAASG